MLLDRLVTATILSAQHHLVVIGKMGQRMHGIALAHQSIEGAKEVGVFAAVVFTKAPKHITTLLARDSSKHVRSEEKFRVNELLREAHSREGALFLRIIHGRVHPEASLNALAPTRPSSKNP